MEKINISQIIRIVVPFMLITSIFPEEFEH